jgi:asparagine synthase (glutamine-hydrolysing)
MTDALTHRGPDGEGVHCFPSEDGSTPAALGHRRLAIIDPTPRGAQPMSYAGGRYWITYNGELYNFRALRSDLERDGFRFESDCDTEVLLAMYARHGPRMLHFLNGIFAFGIWDTERQELFLARDRLGVKPLYYTSIDGTLFFASEVKALLPASNSTTMRRDVLADYLTFLWVPEPDTLFEGIYKLPPGHFATFRSGRLAVEQYWDLSFDPEPAPEQEWVERVRAGVGDAVTRQMMSDVPLGSFLSGGLDSSAIVAMMAPTAARITTQTVGYSGEDLGYDIMPDDVRYARKVARQFDVDYHERILEPDMVDLLPKVIWHLDEPIADPAAITTYLMCSSARQHVTVILSGMGGDELFAGYPRHLAARLARLLDVVPRRARGSIAKMLLGRMTLGPPGRLRGPRRNLIKFLHGLEAAPTERYLTYRSYYRGPELSRMLATEVRDELSSHDPFERHRSYLDRVRGEHWLNQLLYVDIKTFLPSLNLTYTDKMGMAASTEVRVPLLDDELVAMSARIPAALKLKRLRRKYVLKRSMDGVLPHDVIWRPKAGLGAPIRSWLRGDLRPMVDDLLSPARLKARGLFDSAGVQELLDANQAGRADNAFRIWALLTLELWQQTFVDRPRSTPTKVAATA